MPFCTNCGRQNPDDARFCSQCGTPIVQPDDAAVADVPVDATADSLFVKWKDQGVQTVVPRTSAMRSPDRDVLLALLRWFELNVGK